MSTHAALAVDVKGLAKLVERRGKSFAILELVQNAWDENTTTVEVTLHYRGYNRALLEVEDDSPDGFVDLSHAYTLFAESAKKANPEQRGRFNLGEKLVIALADNFSVRTTKGGVEIDVKNNTRRMLRKGRERGSRIQATVRMTRADVEEAARAFHTLIPPAGITTTINGVPLVRRSPLATFAATLPTEIADEEGYLRPTRRQTTVEVYEPLTGERATLYELGIPVVATDDTFHVNVCVAPETRILTSDLRYVSADSVAAGMTLIGFDEHRSPHRRKFRTSTVTTVARLRLPSYRLTFDDGTMVVCSADHQWLCSKGRSEGNKARAGRTSRWSATKDLVATSGGRLGTVVVKPLDVWEAANSYRAGYLAAAFDGEGWLIQGDVKLGVRNTVGFSQNSNLMLENVAAHLTEEGFDPNVKVLPEGHDTRGLRRTAAHHQLRLNSRQEMLRFLGTFRPVRLLSSLEIDRLGTLPTSRGVRLVKKEHIGEQDVIAIGTDTRTFIAEGLASHNCQKVPLNSDRDNVTPSYLRDVRALVLNEVAANLGGDDAAASWVDQALEDDLVSPAAVEQVMTARFGVKRVIQDPSDPEAGRIAMADGYTVIPGRALSGAAWRNVKKAGAALPAGQVTPSPKPFSPDGTPLALMPESEWTVGMRETAAFARRLARHALGSDIGVEFANDIGWPFGAAFGGDHRLTLNVGRLGYGWFDLDHDTERVLDLLIHEFAHTGGAEHMSKEYDRNLSRIGARCTRAALHDPGVFDRTAE